MAVIEAMMTLKPPACGSATRSLPSRRACLAIGAAALPATLLAASHDGRRAADPPSSDPTLIGPPPPLLLHGTGFLSIPGARLWYWDTGGSGPAVVLVHPFTGSALSWPYQQAALVAAGYRVVAYSACGAFRSKPVGAGPTLSGATELAAVVDALQLDGFHLVGAAGGAFAALRYALDHPGRLLGLTLSCSLLGLSESSYAALSASLLPPTFQQLPAAFRELSASYRAGNPRGVERWLAIERDALSHMLDAEAVSPAGVNGAPRPAGPNFADLRAMRLPVQLIYADADLYAPPALARIGLAPLKWRGICSA